MRAIVSEPENPAWTALKVAGRATKHAAKFVARGASHAYTSIDPDVRKHIADLPLLIPTMIGARSSEIPPLPDDGHAPIVCVHGLAGHPRNFMPLRAVMWLHGRTRIYSLVYADDRPLEDAAETLARCLEEIANRNELGEAAKIDVVAHSMGGLVGRMAMFDERCAARVRTFVTLGTPHRGTLAARFLATSRMLDLRPDSPLFEKLNAQLPWKPSAPRAVAFWSRADIFMLPATTAMLEGADNIELDGVSHNGYLIRPTALAKAVESLV